MYGDLVKKVINSVLIVIILGLFSANFKVYAKDTPDELKELYARSAVLMDADSGRILFGKNETDVLPMASTTKIMTCIIALENMKEKQTGEVSENAQNQPKVHLGVRKGEKYYIKDLLYSLMLESHNDSAVVIAEAIAGSVEAFADMMNAKAKEIGCKNTYFITPNGLDAENESGIHSTTAAELALIMRYCIMGSPQSKSFLEITRVKNYQFTDIDEKRHFSCMNHNAFLDMMEGALSGKTGFTNDAGYCYVGALKRDDRTFIVALLACGWPSNKSYKWKDTRKLMEYALNNYQYETIWMENDCGSIDVLNGIDLEHPLKQTEIININLISAGTKIRVLKHKNEKIEERMVKSERLEAPVAKGQKVGSRYYVMDNQILYRSDIVTADTVDAKSLKYMWDIVVSFFCLSRI